MAKYRPLDEIRGDLAACRALLEDLQIRGDAACSVYDLSLGYDAEWYLRSGAIENQIRYFEQELAAATPRQQPRSKHEVLYGRRLDAFLVLPTQRG